jgi:hypothetical protein
MAPARRTEKIAAGAPAAKPVAPHPANAPLGGKPGNAGYMLQVGEYVVKMAMNEAVKKVKNAGMEPVVEPGPKKKEPMVRLYVGEYPSQTAARKEVDKLHAAKLDGFFLTEGGRKYQVYAGSFSDEKGAAREMKRCASLGITTALKPALVAVPTYLLTAGNFPNRVAALAKALELERQGLNPVVIERSEPGKLPGQSVAQGL